MRHADCYALRRRAESSRPQQSDSGGIMQAKTIACAAGLTALIAGQASALEPQKINWAAVPKSRITLFYPGQSTQEWILSAAHKAGATGVREGKNCLKCHADEEADIGKTIVSGKKLEPTPIPRKPRPPQGTGAGGPHPEKFYP